MPCDRYPFFCEKKPLGAHAAYQNCSSITCPFGQAVKWPSKLCNSLACTKADCCNGVCVCVFLCVRMRAPTPNLLLNCYIWGLANGVFPLSSFIIII